jgi:hypothetical protein
MSPSVFSVPRRRGLDLFPPHAGEGGRNLYLKAGDQRAIARHQRLLGLDLGNCNGSA